VAPAVAGEESGLGTATDIGIVGCGKISGIYLQNLSTYAGIRVVACADIDVQRAEVQAERYGVPRACSVEALLSDADVDIVVNLTIPAAHGTVGLAALHAGKSVYNEKPLALNRDEAQRMLAVARERGLRIGGAPDTFLGGGLQTCRKLLDDGAIGVPVAATAFMMSHGHESWHPNPDFYYQMGGGPMFDMGPYYLTALVATLGPVRRVTGSARITVPERAITSQPLAGTNIKVNVPTHVAGVLDFASGPIATIVTSFDVWSANVPRLEIYGSDGTLSLPDPNTFGGPVRLRRAGEQEWSEVPLTHGNISNSRGLGVLDMARAIQQGRPHRANGDLASHVLATMQAIHEASERGVHSDLLEQCERPAAIPAGLADGEID